jgi:hypothetical protein
LYNIYIGLLRNQLADKADFEFLVESWLSLVHSYVLDMFTTAPSKLTAMADIDGPQRFYRPLSSLHQTRRAIEFAAILKGAGCRPCEQFGDGLHVLR